MITRSMLEAYGRGLQEDGGNDQRKDEEAWMIRSGGGAVKAISAVAGDWT